MLSLFRRIFASRGILFSVFTLARGTIKDSIINLPTCSVYTERNTKSNYSATKWIKSKRGKNGRKSERNELDSYSIGALNIYVFEFSLSLLFYPHIWYEYFAESSFIWLKLYHVFECVHCVLYDICRSLPFFWENFDAKLNTHV